MGSRLASIFFPDKTDDDKPGTNQKKQDSGTGVSRDQEPIDGSNHSRSASGQCQSDQSESLSPKFLGPGVRFASGVEAIEPLHSIGQSTDSTTEKPRSQASLAPEVEEEIRNLAIGSQKPMLQTSRMSSYAFEPVSLPPSRATSRDPSPRGSPKLPLGFHNQPPQTTTAIRSPPLTSRDSRSQEASTDAAAGIKQEAQTSTPNSLTSPIHGSQDKATAELVRPPAAISGQSSADEPSTAPTSVSEESPSTTQKRVPRFTVGSSETPSPAEQSPTDTPRSQSPYPQQSSPLLDGQSRKRVQQRPPEQTEQRYPSEKDPKRSSITPVQALQNANLLPKSGNSGSELKHEKRSSIFSGKKDSHAHVHEDGPGALGDKKSHGSMSELKRFFRIGHKHKRGASSQMVPGSSSVQAAIKPLTHRSVPNAVPFADDHGLEAKYGKFGKVLGSGAGGSVRLLKRSSDGVTFAVKQFRERHSWESEKDYAKKVTAEFCIGSTLHHGNIIETMDIIQENDHWYEVMEYAPFDLFATVMTAKMSREEVACSFRQIVNGVEYLHTMGLAHRDLKLDNVVINEHGIMKLIDFGSATVFQYPFENDMVLASGIVGSDPYLAPEVYDEKKYDPTATDVWSLAIIFCCMTLRRFPWKQPRVVDNSYKLFVSAPTPGTPVPDSDRRRSHGHRSRDRLMHSDGQGSEPSSEHNASRGGDARDNSSPHERHHSHGDANQAIDGASAEQSSKGEVIKGPWRLLRILPRESRHIVGRMLKVNPQERATMDEVKDDQWIMSIPVCQQEEQGEVRCAPGHQHTLEAGSAPQPPPDK